MARYKKAHQASKRRSSVRYLTSAPATSVVEPAHTFTVAEPEAPADDAPALDSMLKADLVALAEDRGLDTDGTKADLIERLQS